MWWCPHCKVEVQPEHVTFEETHDERYGGCGAYMDWISDESQVYGNDCPNGICDI